MNGHYKIPLAIDEAPEANATVQRLLKMLDTDAQVTMKVWNEPWESYHPFHGQTKPRYVEIRARGGTPKHRHNGTKISLAPPVPTAEALGKRLAKAQEDLAFALKRLRVELRRQYLSDTDSWQDRAWMERRAQERAKHKRIGQAIGKILARHHVHAFSASSEHFKPTAEDYADLDIVLGRKVERASKVSEGQLERAHSYLGWIVKTYAGSYRFGLPKRESEETVVHEPRPNAIQSMLEVKAEVEYLEELLSLALDRENKRQTA
jgi:hypothetical protein